jgi:flagellar secretion chaperone FliS
MNSSARDEYLTHQVMTASPERLQLMLIEAAVNAAQRAQTLWQQGWDETVSLAILRSQRIVAQVLSGLAVQSQSSQSQSALVGQVTSVYGFVYRALIAAHVERNVARLADALAILELERETWRQVCSHRGTTPHAALANRAPTLTDEAEAGFSFEA